MPKAPVQTDSLFKKAHFNPPPLRTKRKQKENLCICKPMHNDITKTTKNNSNKQNNKSHTYKTSYFRM